MQMYVVTYWNNDMMIETCKTMASTEEQARKNFRVGYPTNVIIKIECLLFPVW